MKKKILACFVVLAAALVGMTGCSKEKPFSIYQLAVDMTGLSTADDPQAVANYVASWFINNGYIMSGNAGNPMILEGADEAANDEQATRLYNNKVSELKNVNLDQVIIDAQENGELDITTTGSIYFSYGLYKGSTVSLMDSYWITVNYAPLSSTTPAGE